ncbi:hypothetical protein Fmac_030203 [Flemingia macrophylla]|uniref:C2 domain-containing protein n=1 Tax=Flemingia macrophylla TaxID=520843 RepID=A0ABD1LCI4_9FABA
MANENQKQNQHQQQNQNQNQNQKQNQKKEKEDFSLKATTPNISAGKVISGDRLPTAYDLVERMQFLFVRVMKAINLPGHCAYVEAKLGSFVGTTRCLKETTSPEWNQVFAFSKESIQVLVLEIEVNNIMENCDCGCNSTELVGRVSFTIGDIPTRIPPDSPLAPQWYTLENQQGEKVEGELMVSVWMGTQADESFPEAWHSDAAEGNGENIAHTRSKVYISPRLWYLRVNVIQAQDLLLKGKTGNNSEIFVQGVLGNLALRSRPMKTDQNLIWNEDLMFVVTEPFEDSLFLSIEQGIPTKHESLGCCVVPLRNVEQRVDATPPASVWYNLQKPKANEDEKEGHFSSKLNMRISLDGGYHVLDEATHYTSDVRPASRSLRKPSIGVLELGILNAVGLSPMKKDFRTDAFCVAKYGPKWVRTRTIVNSLSPKWNEQYTWEVYDPCTVITLVVFDNGNLQGGKKDGRKKDDESVDTGEKNAGGRKPDGTVDKRIGKVRIRLSTLESDRIYTHSYPLINLHKGGARKMGEIQLAVRFSCPSLFNVLQTYAQPLLPEMHYISPLSRFQLDSLRNQAANITALRFKRAEPPLSKDVVEYMLDMGANVWSMRRGKTLFYRVAGLLSVIVFVAKRFDEIHSWKNSITTVLGYFMILFVIFYPEIILPLTFSFLLLFGIWRYRTRPRYPSHMDMKLSQLDGTTVEELEEEFDPFPSKLNGDNLKKRYDRLRGLAGRVLEVMSDLTTQGERVQSLLSWRDPRATSLFSIFCFVAAFVTYFVPFRIMMVIWVTYVLRPPRFRFDMPAVPQNFLRRMPAKSDGLL